MKKEFLLINALIFILAVSYAQTNVKLRILHKSGNQDFKLGEVVVTPDGYNLKFTRLQYYISGITLIHDKGLESKAQDVYILEDASLRQTHDLGVHNVEYIEGIRFHIGVDNGPNPNPNDPSTNTTNHADPALWPSDHALSLKSPAMHWGWASGYRFVCMEGFSGPSTNLSCEMHALGDKNYNEVNLLAGAVNNGGEMVIEINADYLQSLNNVDMATGFYLHSQNGKAATFLNNFKTSVFTPFMDPIKNTTSVGQVSGHDYRMSLYPNPSKGNVLLNFNPMHQKVYNLVIFDLKGDKIREYQSIEKGNLVIQELPLGIYSVSLFENDEIIENKKIVISR